MLLGQQKQLPGKKDVEHQILACLCLCQLVGVTLVINVQAQVKARLKLTGYDILWEIIPRQQCKYRLRMDLK